MHKKHKHEDEHEHEHHSKKKGRHSPMAQKAKIAHVEHESKKTAKHHEHMGMEKHLRGAVKKHHKKPAHRGK